MELSAEANETLGELALLLGNAVRQQDLNLLREVVREIAVRYPDKDAKWAFRTVQRDFEPEQQQWFEWAIGEIQRGE